MPLLVKIMPNAIKLKIKRLCEFMDVPESQFGIGFPNSGSKGSAGSNLRVGIMHGDARLQVRVTIEVNYTPVTLLVIHEA